MKKIIDVNYKHTDENYDKMIDYLVAQSKINNNQVWEAGRTNYAMSFLHGTKAKDDPFFEENIHFWLEGEELVALAISEYGRNDMFVEIAIGYEDLITDVLRWVNEEWNSKNETISVFCYNTDEHKMKFFEKDGFVAEEVEEYERTYNVTEMNCEYELPVGYTIGNFFDNPNYDSRVALTRNVFGGKAEKKHIQKLHESKDYIKDLEVIITSPVGESVAYCIGWWYPGSDDTGYVEPVGTHSDHRRKGLGSTVVKECFKRMAKQGMEYAVISTGGRNDRANAFYDSLKPIEKKTVLKYVKSFG